MELGPRHAETRRLRALLRDRAARAEEGRFVLEGPHVITAALDRGVVLDALYLAHGAGAAFATLAARARDAGARVEHLKEGVLERIGSTRTPQPVLAVAPLATRPIDALGPVGLVVVAVDVADPGNLGTLVRSAEASGAAGLVSAANSVDVHNPKAVRSSAGAIFGVPVVEVADPVEALDWLRAHGRRLLATRAVGGRRYDAADLVSPCAVVLGNEAHGIPTDVEARCDATLTVPIVGPAESLNVAMAGTVLCFEAARQRRAREESA